MQKVKKLLGFSRTARPLAALLWLGVAVGLGNAGCDSECEGDDCSACGDTACGDGQRCVQDECRDACEVDGDCPGDQICRTYQFQPGDEGRYCVVLPAPSGRFTPCENDGECDQAHGFSCFEGECNYPCRSHADCVGIGHCESRVTGGERQTFCARDEQLPAPGDLYTRCPDGDECSDPRLCLGAGVGDLDAYCSIDCASDDECLPGYYCGSVTRPPCEDACGSFAGQPDDPRCVPAGEIGDDQLYRCGELGIVRHVCRQREFCSSCESDADCLAIPNQVCARDESGAKICTRLCEPGGSSCPWGNASTCDVFDDELGVPTCSHRFGACHGTGETCEPCTVDADCPGGLCASSQFTGERWCINLETRCSCDNGVDNTGTCDDGGCPDSPGGLPVLCIGQEQSSLFNTCYAANASGGSLLGESPQTGCWGEN